MEIQRIIDDSSLSTEAKVILLTAEIEKLIRSAPAEEVEVKLMCEETVFHTYRTPYQDILEIKQGHQKALAQQEYKNNLLIANAWCAAFSGAKSISTLKASLIPSLKGSYEN
jgi:hypothetical protein